MQKQSFRSVAATLAMGLSLASAFAQTGATAPAVQTAQAATRLDRSDRAFIEHAAQGGMFEVEAGKLAAAQGGDAAVKNFGNMLTGDHSKANDELKQLASSKGVTLPGELARGQRKQLDKLAKMNGANFDKAFTKDVGMKDHEKDIKMFEKASKNAKDADVKAFAAKTLPVLRAHLAEAHKLPTARGG